MKNNTSRLAQYLPVEGMANSMTKSCISNIIVVSVGLDTMSENTKA